MTDINDIRQSRLRIYSRAISESKERQTRLERLCADIASSATHAKEAAEAAISSVEAIRAELLSQEMAYKDLARCLQWEEERRP